MAVVPGAESSMLLRELAAIRRCDLSLVVSDHEQRLLTHEYGVAAEQVALARWYYLPPPPVAALPPFAARRHFVSIGNFRHAPNLDSVELLAREVCVYVCVFV
jgi:hypothetical protein